MQLLYLSKPFNCQNRKTKNFKTHFWPFNVENDGQTLKQCPQGVSRWGEEEETALLGTYMEDEPQTQISAICWLVGTGEQQHLLPLSWERQEVEVTLIKLVAYENGVMPTGRMWQGFINLFPFTALREWLFNFPLLFLWQLLFLPLSIVPQGLLCVRINVQFPTWTLSPPLIRIVSFY